MEAFGRARKKLKLGPKLRNLVFWKKKITAQLTSRHQETLTNTALLSRFTIGSHRRQVQAQQGLVAMAFQRE